MIPIGPFSELTGLSIKSLRNYHEQGLLIPERIDEHSQERAYSPWQLLPAARISALRRAGLSIAKVKGILEQPESAEGELDAHARELQQRRRDEDAALAEARAMLAAAPRVEVRQAAPLITLTTDLAAGAELIDEVQLAAAADAVAAQARAAGAEPTGLWWSSLEGGMRALVERVSVVIRAPLEDHAVPDGLAQRSTPAQSEVSVRLPTSPQLGAITLAVAHLIAHEVPGHFVDIGRMRRARLGAETEYAAPLTPMGDGEDA